MKCQIPEHGCARCTWWEYLSDNGWGLCILFQRTLWYQFAPCPEYEMNPSADEEIEVILDL